MQDFFSSASQLIAFRDIFFFVFSKLLHTYFPDIFPYIFEEGWCKARAPRASFCWARCGVLNRS